MDLSGLIFVALAVAWAAYLIPKALRHHDDVVRSRSVDRFSAQHAGARPSRAGQRAEGPPGRARPRGDPRSGRPSRRTAGRAVRRAPRRHRQATTPPPPRALAPAGARDRRHCGRRRVHRIAWSYVAIPAALLLAWLVACRLMVTQGALLASRSPSTTPT